MLHHIKSLKLRLSERYNDWRYGIYTDAEMWPSDLGSSDPERHMYTATNYKRFHELMGYITVKPGKDVFLDYGSGMGRAVVLAATYPFRKVIGIELSGELHDIAVKNVAKAKGKLACQDIELLKADALSYAVPADMSVAFFWSPFGSSILKPVLDNIWASVRAHPRPVTVLYIYAPGMSCLDEIKPELPFLTNYREVKLGSGLCATIGTMAPPRS